MEVPVEMNVSMAFSDANKLAIKRCELWVVLQNKKPIPINGKFEDATAEIHETLHESDSENLLTDESSNTDEESVN